MLGGGTSRRKKMKCVQSYSNIQYLMFKAKEITLQLQVACCKSCRESCTLRKAKLYSPVWRVWYKTGSSRGGRAARPPGQQTCGEAPCHAGAVPDQGEG